MIFYIIKYNNQYIFFSNLRDENLRISKARNCSDISIKSDGEFYDELRNAGERAVHMVTENFGTALYFIPIISLL